MELSTLIQCLDRHTRSAHRAATAIVAAVWFIVFATLPAAAQPADDVLAKVGSALAERDARIAELERQTTTYARPEDDWPKPPEQLTWPVHQVIELDAGEQGWPWDAFPKSAPAGTRIIIRPKRVTDDGEPQNIRPVINAGPIRWGRGLENTVVEIQDCVLVPDGHTYVLPDGGVVYLSEDGEVISATGNRVDVVQAEQSRMFNLPAGSRVTLPRGDTVMFLGHEVNIITRRCTVKGDHGDTKDALNHQRMIGFVATIDTRFVDLAFGLRSVDYASNVEMSVIADDGIQGTPHIEGANLSGLIRYTNTHPDATELGNTSGLRWDGFHARGIDGQGFAAGNLDDCLILNSSVVPDSEFDAYAFAVHNLSDFWWMGGLIEGRLRITGEVDDNSGFVGVDFVSPWLQIEAMARKGMQFIDCTNYGKPIITEELP